jgi:hypothetical protein
MLELLEADSVFFFSVLGPIASSFKLQMLYCLVPLLLKLPNDRFEFEWRIMGLICRFSGIVCTRDYVAGDCLFECRFPEPLRCLDSALA